MDLTYFRTFREVARKKSFTRAAADLGYAQSSVTMQIQKLEREYGVALVERYGRELRLTPPGEHLLKLAGQMLDLYDQSKEMIADQACGTLTIGTIDSLAAYYLPPFLQQFRSQYPGLNMQMLPDSESSLVSRLKDGDYDIGFILDRYPADLQLRCIQVRQEPLLIVAPVDHPLAQQASVDWPDLAEINWIVTEESCVYRNLFEKLLKEHRIPFHISFELGNLEAIKQCVKNGLGLALLPQVAVESELAAGKLAALPFAHRDMYLDLQLLVHPKKWVSRTLQAFIDMLTHTAPEEA